MEKKNENWDLVIDAKTYRFSIKELLMYKDLIFLFVKRDFISVYKQTILGPLWFFIQPILTTITFTVIFGNIAGISTDGVPPLLFYLSGIVLWTYFSDCFMKTSNTFVANQQLFGKVYFPRVVLPISISISNLLKLGIQLLLFTSFYLYYLFSDFDLKPNIWLLTLPVIIVLLAIMGLGFGMIISSLTTKYRDLKFLIQFGVQLLMYGSPIVYPLSIVEGKLKMIILLNPVSSLIETFKYACLGSGSLPPTWSIVYSTVFTFSVLFLGIFIFNKVEKNFMDTV